MRTLDFLAIDMTSSASCAPAAATAANMPRQAISTRPGTANGLPLRPPHKASLYGSARR